MENSLALVGAAIEAIKKGGMVILVDDEDRENEGDLVFAAEDVDSAKINFMVREARGLVCLSLVESDILRLNLPLMSDSRHAGSKMNTAFTVSIEAAQGVTTGISAQDRAKTIEVAINPFSGPKDIIVPGHVFPLKARKGGVLERVGHTEGSVDLCGLAGKKRAAVICEIMSEDGTMARMPELTEFGQKHGIPLLRIADLVAYRLCHDTLVEKLATRPFETDHGVFEGVWYKSLLDESVHFALKKGEMENEIVHVRVQKENSLMHVFGSEKHGRWEIEYGLKMLKNAPAGVFLYLSDVGSPKLSMDTAGGEDFRLYGVGAQILRHLGVKKMALHMRSEKKLVGLNGFGLEIAQSYMME